MAMVGLSAVLVTAALVAITLWVARPTGDDGGETEASAPAVTPSLRTTPTPTPSEPPAPVFDRSAHSIDDPPSIWVVTNKLRPLNPADYAPSDLVTAQVPGTAPLRAEAATAIEAMVAAASAEAGLSLAVQNAYRSYDTQVWLYQSHVDRLGEARARAQSAMPGYSEHQTGLTADIMGVNDVCTIEECFAATPEGMWLAENAGRFGFHLRYPQGKTDVTGYIFEPWHYRYVGTDLAAELHATGTLTLEEFFGLPPAPDYPPGV